MKRTIRDLMTKNVVTVTLQDNVHEIAVKMRDHNIGFIPVVDGGRAIGCVTDRDLVIRGYAEKRPGSAEVAAVMTSPCVKVSPDITPEEAAGIMASRQIRRLVVEEDGRLVGVVAIGDLAVRDDLRRESGEALGEISEPGRQPAGIR